MKKIMLATVLALALTREPVHKLNGAAAVHACYDGLYRNAKAIAHRDYFDMGEFVYERVPVLRLIIRHIKNRMAGS